MYADARKMKRTKRQQLFELEKGNGVAISDLFRRCMQFEDRIINQNKAILVLTAVLKQKGVVNELELSQALHALEEIEKMEKQATIIDPNKNEIGG